MLAETQAVAMAGLLGDDADDADDAAVGGTEVGEPGTAGSDEGSSPGGAPAPSSGPAVTPEQETEAGTDADTETDAEAASVPFVASGHSDTTFEIDEVEALPDEEAGVTDLHEGASDFIPVEPHHPEGARHHGQSGD